MKQQSLKSLVLAITAGSLVACGSADGGSDSGAPKLTGQLATDSVESAARSGAMVGAGVSVGQQGESSASTLEENAAGPRSGRALEFSSACLNASGSLLLSISDDFKSYSMTFSQCMGEDLGYTDGYLGIRINDVSEDQRYVNMSMDYQSLTITSAGGDSFFMNGVIQAEIDENKGSMNQSSSRFEAKETISGVTESVVLEEYSFNATNLESDIKDYNYDFYITGDEGTFHIWTEGNLQVNSFGAQSGQLYIEGENAKLSVTLSNTDQTPMASLALDTDKDGTADLTGEMTQAEFFADEDVLSGSL